jgi:hypothetical protein
MRLQPLGDVSVLNPTLSLRPFDGAPVDILDKPEMYGDNAG